MKDVQKEAHKSPAKKGSEPAAPSRNAVMQKEVASSGGYEEQAAALSPRSQVQMHGNANVQAQTEQGVFARFGNAQVSLNTTLSAQRQEKQVTAPKNV